MEPNDREVSKLERMSDESGEIERETFTAYAKKSEAFKEYMEAERKSGIDKAEIAFKVNLLFLKILQLGTRFNFMLPVNQILIFRMFTNFASFQWFICQLPKISKAQKNVSGRWINVVL